MKRPSLRAESILYAILGILLAAAPVAMEWFQTLTDSSASFSWEDVCEAWLRILPFVLLFLLHDMLLAPLLVIRGRHGRYLLSTVAVVAVFTIYQCQQHPPRPPHERARHEKRFAERPPHERNFKDRPPRHDNRPPLLLMRHDVTAVVILVLMFGMNLGIKYYFHQHEEDNRRRERERERIQQQLAYLQYQVNPHFLMNTLNNIHALIDIEPEAAQDAIVELSRLLRYTLYESDRQSVPLAHEVEFLGHYIALMRIRYTEQVEIRLDAPAPLPSVTIPPLLYATFVENAFKHGVSYLHPSFVHVAFAAHDQRLLFTCRNSRGTSATPAAEGGLGLRNVRQRLELLFPGNYDLRIQEDETTYTVHLDIPLQPRV